MAKLFLLRHLKSQWNLEDRFAGWVDNPLSKEGSEAAKLLAENMKNDNFDVIYTSPLIRCKQTVIKLLRNLNEGTKYPIFKSIDGGKMQKWSEEAPNFFKIYAQAWDLKSIAAIKKLKIDIPENLVIETKAAPSLVRIEE